MVSGVRRDRSLKENRRTVYSTILSLPPSHTDVLEKFDIDLGQNIMPALVPPCLEFFALWKDAGVVPTYSSELQGETTTSGIPSVTIWGNTERSGTKVHTRMLAGTAPNSIAAKARTVLGARSNNGSQPTIWDNACAERIVDIFTPDLGVPQYDQLRGTSSGKATKTAE